MTHNLMLFYVHKIFNVYYKVTAVVKQRES